MIRKKFYLVFNLNDGSTIETGFKVVQNDVDAYTINAVIFDGSAPIDYELISSATITYEKPDGKIVQRDMTVESNMITCIVKSNEISVLGVVKASIQLYGEDDERLSLLPFTFEVTKDMISPPVVESTNEFPILQKLVQDVHTIIPMLPEIQQIAFEMPGIIEFFDAAEVSEVQRVANENTRQAQEAARQASIADIINQFNNLVTAKQQEAEVIIARDGEANLKARLDRDKQELSSQLAQTATKEELLELNRRKADQSFVDSQFATIVSGAPRGTYTDLNALREAYPEGTEGVMLVLDDGHWYYWNETAQDWLDGGIYQATGIDKESVFDILGVSNSFPVLKDRNLIVNGNINDGINNWQTYQNLATLSVVDGRLRSTADDAGNAAYIGQWGNWNRPVNTKFYIVYHICGNKSGIVNIGLVHDSFFTVVQSKININVTTSLTRHSNVITSSELTIGGIRFRGTDYTSPGDYIEVDNVLCVDLTALFGIGNEPSKEVMDMILFANENGLIEPDDILLVDKIRSTVQSVIFNNGMIEQIQHKSGDLIIRQDEFTFTDNSVTEKRSIPTGESITFINHLDTFETEVI